MEINEFVKKIADQFDNTDMSVFTPKTVFRELEGYSLIVALSIIAMVDEEYGVLIGANEMKTSITIEDIYNIVKAKVE
jgi:acyl carrier protein